MRKKPKAYCLILLILFINSVICKIEIFSYISSEENTSDELPLSPTLTEKENVPLPPSIAETINTSGIFKTKGFFTQDQFVDLDENGYVFEFEEYDDMRHNGADSVYCIFEQDKQAFPPSIYWPPVDTYQQLRSESNMNGKKINSTIFTPVFNFDTKIQGKIFFLIHGDVWPSANSNWTLRITVEDFNPLDQSTSFITSTAGYFDDTPTQGVTFEANLAETVTISAGHRLRLTYEVMRDEQTVEGVVEITTGELDIGSLLPWFVNDVNNTYDNNYRFNDISSTIGVQFLMYEENFPTIDLQGYANNTIY